APGRARRQRLAKLAGNTGLELVAGDLARQRTRGAAHRGRGQQRRSEQPDHYPDPRAPPQTLPPGVIPGVRDGDLAALVMGDQDDALDLDLPALDEPDQPVEVLPCLVQV